YHDILGRSPDVSGWNFCTNLLAGGSTRDQVAQQFLTSAEYYGKVVDGLYATYLDRKADPAGRAAWVTKLSQGATEDQLATDFVMSSEYASQHAGDKAFVDALYSDILGRNADAAGEAAHVASLSAGKSRGQVVADFLNSTERYRHVVDD